MAETQRRFDSLDGLRGFACLAVLAHHCYYHAGRYTWPLGIPRLMSYGYLGVELFFVLSGFCLAYPALLRGNEPIAWRPYAIRRARRIFPAYLAALILFALIGLALSRQPRFAGVFSWPGYRQSAYATVLAGIAYNTSFWTLTVEARWYLLLPFLLLLMRRAGWIVLLAACVVASLARVLLHNKRLEFWIGPLPLFLPLFGLGMLSAGFAVKLKGGWATPTTAAILFAGLLVSIAAVALFIPAHPNETLNYRRLVPAGLASFFLVTLAVSSPLANRVLSWRPLVGVGLFSYSLYLVHLPLVHLAYRVTKTWNLSQPMQFAVYVGFVAPLCIAVGYLFYRVFEKPWLSSARTGQR